MEEKVCRTCLVIALERSTKLADEPGEHQLSNIRQFCVDNRYESGKDWGEREGRCLRLHDGAGKETFAANQIFREEFRNDHFYVGHIDTVDNTSDRLSKGVPHEPLVFWAGLVLRSCRLHRLESGWWHVDASRATTDKL